MLERSPQLSPLSHSLLMFFGIGGAYWWVHFSALHLYSLQLFAGLGLIYFILKKISAAHRWHFLPAAMSLEAIVATTSLLVLIGATGGTTSWFYPLAYLVLFLVVFSSQVISSIFTTLMMMLFLYGTSSALHQHEIVAILSLPIVMLFLIFAKNQQEEAIKEQLLVQEETTQLQDLSAATSQLENFLHHFLEPKLDQLSQLLAYPQNLAPIKGQINLIKLEIERLLQRLRKQPTK